MKLEKSATKSNVTMVRVDLEIEKPVVEQLQQMTEYTKIPKGELVTTALKRFISAHKDYFPGN